MNAVKVVRNNWKKTAAFIGVSAVGFKYVRKKYRSAGYAVIFK